MVLGVDKRSLFKHVGDLTDLISIRKFTLHVTAWRTLNDSRLIAVDVWLNCREMSTFSVVLKRNITRQDNALDTRYIPVCSRLGKAILCLGIGLTRRLSWVIYVFGI